MSGGSRSAQIRHRKIGTYLMLGFMLVWITTMLSIQFYQAHVHGYGSGFGDGGRLTPDIVAEYGEGWDARKLAAKETQGTPEIGAIESLIRAVLTIFGLAAIPYFWYQVMSRIGTF